MNDLQKSPALSSELGTNPGCNLLFNKIHLAMVKIIDFKKRENASGEEFFVLVLQGGLQIVKSEETNRCYATMKQATMSTTFDEGTCKSLIGEEIPGSIAKVETEPYDYTVPETGEVITLSHRWEYVRESDKLAEIVFDGKPEEALSL